MNDPIDRLANQVRLHLAAHPADAGKILRTVADAMADYERAQNSMRSVLADAAIRAVLDPDWIARHPAAFSIDALFHQFLNGPQNHAPREMDCWRAFRKRCAEEPISLDWLRATRGEQCADWFARFVAVV